MTLTRRTALAGGLASLAAPVLATATGLTAPRIVPARQNLLVILADDLGWSDLGCFGGEIATPVLDELAANGLRIRRFYNIGKCYPSRASLLTGQINHRAGFAGGIARADRPLPPPGPYQGYLNTATPTIAELLRPHGYRSYISGKWHVGERSEHWPHRRGFDRSFGLISGASSYFELTREEGRRRAMTLDGTPWAPDSSAPFYATDAYADMAIQMIGDHARDHGDSPFFLYLAFTAPHYPIHAREADIERFAGVYDRGWDEVRRNRFERAQLLKVIDERFAPTPRPSDVPAWSDVADRAPWVRRMQVYAAMIHRMDHAIGRVIAALKQSGRFDDTLIVVASDNGASHEDVSGRQLHDHSRPIGAAGSYESIRAPWAWAANAPFQFHKETSYEGGINSPAIIHWPRGQVARGMCDHPLHIADIAPTALELALGKGEQASTGFYGRSVLPLLAGQRPAERELFMEHWGWGALMRGEWKLVYDRARTAWRLFNIVDDPVERSDLAAAEPVRLQHMIRAWTDEARALGVRNIPA